MKNDPIITEKTTVDELRIELEKREVADVETSLSADGYTVRAILCANRGPEGRFCTPYLTGKTMPEAYDTLVKYIDKVLASYIAVRAPSGQLAGLYPRNGLGERYAREMRKRVGSVS